MKKKSTFSVLFYLKANQPKKNGEVPIMVRVTINSQCVTFGTKQLIHPGDWSKELGKAMVNKRRTNTDRNGIPEKGKTVYS